MPHRTQSVTHKTFIPIRTGLTIGNPLPGVFTQKQAADRFPAGKALTMTKQGGDHTNGAVGQCGLSLVTGVNRIPGLIKAD